MDIATLYTRFQACSCVTTDSRNCPKGSLFFALKGASFNGNAFAAKALEAGCRYAVIDEAAYLPEGDSRYILTDNCLLTLQQLARTHRRQLGTPILGITGTNGKTTTKELVAAVLSQGKKILYTQGNLNNAIGVPLTLLQLKPEHELAVVEMGASHPGDIKELVEIAEPDFGLITNVGRAHLLGFGSFEGVVRTKGELYEFLAEREQPATLFLDADNPHLTELVRQLDLIKHGVKQITYGTGTENHISGSLTGCSPYLTFSWTAAGEAASHHVETQLIGAYNLSNALAAVAVGRYFGIAPAEIDRALAGYTPRNNRSQLLRTADNTLIVDAYNANPTSMAAAIRNFCQMEAEEKLLILGDMRELGDYSAEEHQKIVDLLVQSGFRHNVWLVGDQFAATRHPYRTFPDAAAVIHTLQQEKPHGKTILIKGSNGIRLGSVVEHL